MTVRTPLEILVSPPDALRQRPRLFASLGQALGVRFVSEAHRPAAAVAFGPEPLAAGVPRVVYLGEEERGDELVSNTVSVAAVPDVDDLLSGRDIDDDLVRNGVVEAGRGTVLASTAQGPVWVRRGDVDEVALVPEELGHDERLRQRMSNRRFLALLPLLELVRRIDPAALPRPALRATFVFDDPNLHRPTYGWVSYRDLAVHAVEHDYHVNIAVIPLDCWHVSHHVARVVSASDRMSLVVHGNDHLRHELAATTSGIDRVAAQAMGRVELAAERHGLRFDPVMVPPHGKCSAPMMDELRRAGFQAVAYWKPTGVERDQSLDGWAPADRHVGDGLPGVHRTRFSTPLADLVLRAYLGHPLVLYGHHEDCADGLGVLADAAARVREVGPVTWCSLGEVVRRCVAVRSTPEATVVTPLASSVEIDLSSDDAMRPMVVVPHPLAPVPSRFEVHAPGGISFAIRAGERFELEAGGGVVRLGEPGPVNALDPVVGIRRPWPLARRAITEVRDRAAPITRGLRGRRLPSRSARS